MATKTRSAKGAPKIGAAKTSKNTKTAKKIQGIKARTMKGTARGNGATKNVAMKRAMAKSAATTKTPRFTYANLTFTEQDHSIYDAAVGHFR